MDGVHNSVMIALLPTTTSWCKQDLPHMTLVYAGEIPDLKPTLKNELAKAALELSLIYPKFTLDVIGLDQFGDKAEVEVLVLKPTPELFAMRKSVVRWNSSEHTDYKPHATVGPIGSAGKNIPSSLTFDRIVMAWGKDHLVYKLLG